MKRKITRKTKLKRYTLRVEIFAEQIFAVGFAEVIFAVERFSRILRKFVPLGIYTQTNRNPFSGFLYVLTLPFFSTDIKTFTDNFWKSALFVN